MKRITSAVLAVSMLCTLVAPAARAEIIVERSSDENPVVEISRATMAGAMVGALLGYSISLVDDGNKDTDAVQWGFFLGTVGGLALGIHNAYTRPQPKAMLQFENGELHANALPTVAFGEGVRAHLVGVRF